MIEPQNVFGKRELGHWEVPQQVKLKTFAERRTPSGVVLAHLPGDPMAWTLGSTNFPPEVHVLKSPC